MKDKTQLTFRQKRTLIRDGIRRCNVIIKACDDYENKLEDCSTCDISQKIKLQNLEGTMKASCEIVCEHTMIRYLCKEINPLLNTATKAQIDLWDAARETKEKLEASLVTLEERYYAKQHYGKKKGETKND